MLNVQIFQSGRVPAKSTDYFTIEGLEYQLRHFVGSSNKSAVCVCPIKCLTHLQ